MMAARRKKQRLSWPFTNLTLLLISVVVALVLSKNEQFQYVLHHLNGWGYFGAFVAGILYVLSFTAALSIVILISLAQQYSPLEVALLAGAGAVIGDLIIFRLVRDNLHSELSILYRMFGGNHLTKLLNTPYFGWMTPLMGALIIASPGPDELGVSLLGLSKMSQSAFVGISFFLNALGLTVVLTLALLAT